MFLVRLRRTLPWRRALGWRRTARGFTLIELMVVIFVLGILLAILIPSVQQAKEYAYDVICRSNLAELAKVLHTYGHGWDARVPSAAQWIAYVNVQDAWGVLKCPKHFGGGGGPGEIGVEGDVKQIGPPKSVGFDDLESDTIIHAFIEQQNFVLARAVNVNITRPGRYRSDHDSTAGVIPAGAGVDCHFLHFAPVGHHSAESSGSITMGANIIGVICRDRELDASDTAFALPDTWYPYGQPARGFERNVEDITLEDDMRTITIHRFHSTFPGEQVRIITVPGGSSSYGMNSQVSQKMPRLDQMMLVEYGRPVVDVHDGRFWELLALRHFGEVNTVLAGGSARRLRPRQLDPNRPVWKANR